ncbi:transporter [Corynebacterium sp. ES2794-CONJ1]|uniref:aspartate:alanine exchanger family transporter n=1 Tax=unclassified Corynebacterium TaxID=2624378 RepID=UPI002167964F|nr:MULTISPECIES: aspartate:alanine exchanger family transporter [unclassified Corynebacterium]MCS4490738.1 transporter [Corynebacterium sp. ES2775-CONJ]MCS4492540.1 transporter [Corynebacterium sp. ES2715-CONJ3]MCS4532641.1 transporter [Corynebacterium sp. ES2730-CONJ]MCU9520036.1 transporter [Corynebacterium sp. ES2794-CONJ1]
MQLLVENQLLALITIMAVGLLVGKIRIGNFRLGVAAVLFVGLAFATIEPRITLPPILFIVGLSLFVYTIGLEAGPTFFASMKTIGLKNNMLGFSMIIVLTGISYIAIKLAGIDAASGAGLFTGAGTNTPAMAAIVDTMPQLLGNENSDVAELPVVAYSLAYPIGVLGVILSIALMSKVFKINHEQEAKDAGVAVTPLETRRFKVTEENLPPINQWPHAFELEIIVSRIEHNGKFYLPEPGDEAELGDTVSIVGTAMELDKVGAFVGEHVPGSPTHGETIDYRRIFVSSPDIVGIPLRKLRSRLHDMLVTQVRRGDMDTVATPDTVLQLGDRVRVVAPRGRIDQATRIFGDSYKSLSDINLLPLVTGLGFGVLLGMVALPLVGGAELKLGSAGGPLIVALLLGYIERTGPVVWQVPYGANLALRQFGITLFLAGIGTTAGAGFGEALKDPESLKIIFVGAIGTIAMSLCTLIVGYKLLKIPFGQVAGILAGMQTHPAILSYVSDHTRNELPSIGYTTVYPMAMVTKILCAQLLAFALVLT